MAVPDEAHAATVSAVTKDGAETFHRARITALCVGSVVYTRGEPPAIVLLDVWCV